MAMERVLEIVMPWLNAENVSRLGCTCRFLAEAARAVVRRRTEDATQGWESVAVPIENRVDDCAHPDVWYCPFMWVASSGRKVCGRWGRMTGEWREAGRSILNESEYLGGALLVGSALEHAGIGCKCGNDCSNDFLDGFGCKSQSSNPENGAECNARKDDHQVDASGNSVGIWIKTSEFQEHQGAEVIYEKERWSKSQTDWKSEHASKLKKRRMGGLADDCACPCGRILGGNLVYSSTSGSLAQKPVSKEKPEIPWHVFPEMGVAESSDQSTDRFNQEQQETTLADVHESPLLMECGLRCSCSSIRCRFRMSQRGLAVRVKVVRTRFKGWSLQALQDVKQGSFVCEYAGEVITTKEAKKRLEEYDRMERRDVALLILREHLPSRQASVRVNIDATRTGNVARFINHSCDGGNLMRCLVRVVGSVIPKLALFARRDIVGGEELTFSYGQSNQADKNARHRCFCGTALCSGWLPSEST